MKILHVLSSAEFSTYDVAVGYSAALRRAGHEVIDWYFYNRIKHVSRAFGAQVQGVPPGVLWHASRMVVEDIVEHDVDLVFITSGLSFHPNALVLIRRLNIPIVVAFTESPYEDEAQEYFAELCDVVCTNDRYSANKYGWTWLPASYDADIHFPRPQPSGESKCGHDVVVVGTGWDERVARLMDINWSGIDLGLYGFWPQIDKLLPDVDPDPVVVDKLGSFLNSEVKRREETVELYASSKICINDHRSSLVGLSLNPRIYEVLAVGGGLLLTDYREDIEGLLGRQWREFVFESANELSDKIHYYLKHEKERRALVKYGLQCVQGCTFDTRVRMGLEGVLNDSNLRKERSSLLGSGRRVGLSYLPSK